MSKSVDLIPEVQLSESVCLNEDERNPLKNAIKSVNDGCYLKSDADAQLLITLQFKSAVKIQSIGFISPDDGPSLIKLFVDRRDVDFSDVESLPVAELVQVKSWDGSLHKLNFANFQNVHVLTIFVQENAASCAQTVINRICLQGDCRQQTGGHGKISVVSGLPAFESQLKAAGDKLVVVDFFATWCGPCKAIAPLVASLSEEFTDVVFMQVDVDRNKAVAQQCGVNSMPTFQFFKNAVKVAEFSGANAERLRQTVEQLR